MLENFNQEVNKFVNLDSHQINFYGNKDLPKNIFDDPDHWFYDKSPNDWYLICKNQGSRLPLKYNKPLLEQVEKMHKVINEINQIRFEADDFINQKDLNLKTNQEKIYVILEKGVALFDTFYQEQKKLKQRISYFLTESKINVEYFEIEGAHDEVTGLLESLRNRNDNDWDAELTKLITRSNLVQASTGVTNKLNAFISGAREFIETASVISEYRLYGKYYYYHNSKLLNYVNRYGNGYVNSHNENINTSKHIKLMEIPHFYQVIYPSRWLEDLPLASSDPLIVTIPDQLKSREITISDRVIEVDSEVVELEIYDHQLIDGDIVSVNFNGDWILEQYQLKGKPYKLNVKLNKEGKNYLLLHAENLGKQPPNTMALRYRFKGKPEVVVLSSDMDESEVIELVVAK